jgi:transposase
LRERIKGKMLIASDEGDVVNGVVINLYGEETNGAISIIEQPFEPGLLLPPHVDENDVWLHVLEMRRAGLSLRAIADVMKAAGFVLSHVGVKKVLEAAEGDRCGRPLAFLLTGGQAADCQAAERLLERVPPGVVVHADKGYDTDRVRQLIESRGSAPNIAPRSHRRWKNCFSPYLYRGRNAIERMFGRLKDFRRIATRYDRLARNYLAALSSPPPLAIGYESGA